MSNHSLDSVERTNEQESLKENRIPVLLSIILCIITTMLLISTVAFGILYGIERNKTTGQKGVLIRDSERNDLCLNPYCIEAANSLLQSLDETINPCENFYQFTCGKWIRNAKIQDDANSYDIFETMQEKLNDQMIELLSSPSSNVTQEPNATINSKKLYASCIDEEKIQRDGIYPVISLIKEELGGWPILEGSRWNASSFDLYRSMIKLSQLNRFLLFSIQTSIDEKNSSAQAVLIGQSSLALGDRAYYLNETNVTIAYRRLIKDFALLLTNDTSMIDDDVKRIFQFEKSLAQIFWTRAQRYLALRNRTTFANLSSIINTTFRFGEYLRRVYLLANVSLVGEDIVMIGEMEVLQNVSMLIEGESPRTIQNYFIWRFLMGLIEHMPKRFRNIKQEFDRIFRGIKVEKARRIKCAQYVNEYMGLAVSKLYIDRYFDQNSQKESIEMINNIRNVFSGMVNESRWMDSKSKQAAMEKINGMSQRVGYPDGLDRNITDLERTYAHYRLNSSYMQNILVINRLRAEEDLQKLRKPIDRKAWTWILPTDINAYYRWSFNDITFTAAILQTPFFNKDAPKYLNYGGIGMVIGHELTHGFDSVGRQFDKNGNRIPWWTNETIEAFDKQKICIIDQYSNYTVTQINLNVNGKQTQGEDIADNGGLKQTFFAYQKWAQRYGNREKRLPGLSKYSPEQMFFINFGQLWCEKTKDQYARNAIFTDLHSPAAFRTIGPTSNFVEFDRAFGCQPGQGNSRVNKCTVW